MAKNLDDLKTLEQIFQEQLNRLWKKLGNPPEQTPEVKITHKVNFPDGPTTVWDREFVLN